MALCTYNTPYIEQLPTGNEIPKKYRGWWTIQRLVVGCGTFREWLWKDLKWRSYAVMEPSESKPISIELNAYYETKESAQRYLNEWESTNGNTLPKTNRRTKKRKAPPKTT